MPTTPSRMPIIAGNWKMHHDHLVAIQVVQKLSYRLDVEDYEVVDVVVCPPFTDLRTLQTLIDAATASATVRVPAAKGASSNMPIGPFQSTVFASVTMSA